MNFYRLLKPLSTHISCRFLHKHVFKMDKAYLRNLNDSEQFQITFQFRNPELKVDRQFNLCRKLKEDVNNFLTRVAGNVSKVVNKKSKKKRKVGTDTPEDIAIDVRLNLNGSEVDGATICEQIFKHNAGDSIVLKIFGSEYTVIIDSPWVDGIALPCSIMANFPVYPVKFDTVFTNKGLSEFNWYKSQDKVNWSAVGSGFIYMPTNEDIGSYLKITCTPKNERAVGPIVEVVSDVAVEASPGFCPFENRHKFTKERATGKEFRVVTYNILADLYCDSDFSRTMLFPYCPPYALHIDYRKQLILKELIGYNADIICLQELDSKVYVHDLDPVFTSLNYGSTFQAKGDQIEGVACIYNNERFRLLESSRIILGEQLDKNPIFGDIWEKVSQNEKLAERVLQRTTTLQATVLESKEYDEILLVANTHLYFHPDADHIRLLQGGMAIRYVNDMVEKLKQKVNKRISVIFCGDFNSSPDCGIYRLYTTGTALESLVDWKSNKSEAVLGLSLTQPLQLASACGTPQFTNYTATFAGCLDYIFYDTSHLAVSQVIPLPTMEELTQNTALPSIVFPSDHISLVSDLKWL